MVQYQTVQVINVTNLIFTAECLSPSALRKVSRRCHGRANCSVLADTQTFGDPCFPGTRKHLRVSFTCGARRTGCCRFWLTWFAASCKKTQLSFSPQCRGIFWKMWVEDQQTLSWSQTSLTVRVRLREASGFCCMLQTLTGVWAQTPLACRWMVHWPHLQASKRALNQLSGDHWKNIGYVHWCL